MATRPMAFGQQDTIIKAIYDKDMCTKVADGEAYGDPLRPGKGSLVYQIQGGILFLNQDAGFTEVQVHHVTSWKPCVSWHIPVFYTADQSIVIKAKSL